MKIKEEREPGCGLMLRDRSNDGNMNFGISGIPERVESTTPWSNDSSVGQTDNGHKNQGTRRSTRQQKEVAELGFAQKSLQILQECHCIQESKDTWKQYNVVLKYIRAEAEMVTYSFKTYKN
jgi:hypothetical protein